MLNRLAIVVLFVAFASSVPAGAVGYTDSVISDDVSSTSSMTLPANTSAWTATGLTHTPTTGAGRYLVVVSLQAQTPNDQGISFGVFAADVLIDASAREVKGDGGLLSSAIHRAGLTIFAVVVISAGQTLDLRFKNTSLFAGTLGARTLFTLKLAS